MLQRNPMWNGVAFTKDVRQPDVYQGRLHGKIKALAPKCG